MAIPIAAGMKEAEIGRQVGLNRVQVRKRMDELREELEQIGRPASR